MGVTNHEVREEWQQHGHARSDEHAAAADDEPDRNEFVCGPSKLLLDPVLQDLEDRLGKDLAENAETCCQ